MQIKLMRAECGSGRTCPNINSTDRDSYVVQGYCVENGAEVADGEATVEVPLSLLPELASSASRTGLFLTDVGTVLVRGAQVTDPSVLAELQLPLGENAVEVSRVDLPELEEAHAR